MREILNSSNLAKLLQTVGYPIKIGNLKALLKELNFNWNGASCSLTQLLEKLRQYTKDPHVDKVDELMNALKHEEQPKTKGLEKPMDQETLHKILKNNRGSDDPINTLGQMFYNRDQNSLYAIYKEFASEDKNNF